MKVPVRSEVGQPDLLAMFFFRKAEENGELFFLQCRTHQGWRIPRSTIHFEAGAVPDTPFSRALISYDRMKSAFTTWEIEPPEEEAILTKDLFGKRQDTCICPLLVQGQAPIEEKHSGIFRWTPFLEVLRSSLPEDFTQEDRDIIALWSTITTLMRFGQK